MKKMVLLTLIFSFIFASSALANQVTAKINSRCFPEDGTFTVPAGKKAVGFKVMGLSNGSRCHVAGKPDCRGWGINSNKAKIYRWTQCKTNKPYESRSLSTLILGPGTYKVYVDGGKGAYVIVNFK